MSKIIYICLYFLTLCFIICSNLLALEVAVYYDASKGNAWINPAQFTPAIEAEFKAKGIPYQVVSAKELEAYMKANKQGIAIMTMGIAPGEIFKNQGEKDLVRTWLFDGGVMFWSGDWPFYYWDAPANCPAGAGEVSVFGVTFTQGAGPPGAAMTPTDIGKKMIPSMKDHPSSRPVSLAILNNNKFEFESYADDKSRADPIALRAPKMNGWFVNFYTWPENVELKQVSKEMAELLENRFMTAKKAVDISGKLTNTWGKIKK